MTLSEFILVFGAGIFVGWLTKIPWFLKHYRRWERENKSVRKWIDSHYPTDDKERTP